MDADTDIDEPKELKPLEVEEAIRMLERGMGGKTFAARMLPMVQDLAARTPSADVVEELRGQLTDMSTKEGERRKEAQVNLRKFEELSKDPKKLCEALTALAGETKALTPEGVTKIKEAIEALDRMWFDETTQRLADELMKAAAEADALKEPSSSAPENQIPGQGVFPGMEPTTTQ